MNAFKSKKFLAAILNAVLVIVLKTADEQFKLGIGDDTIFTMTAGFVAYIVGQTSVDRKLIENGHKEK
ncbi:hypothetical protein [Bacillus phage vB_BceS-M2]